MTIFPKHLLDLSQEIINLARDKKLYISTAESCTGGLISACITTIPGSSDVFDCGFITYSYQSKKRSLKVPSGTIENMGAVSNETAMEMAMGACNASELATIAISTTGIAGPSGATDDKPVGLVHIGFYRDHDQKIYATKNYFKGDRSEVRLQTTEAALNILKEELEKY